MSRMPSNYFEEKQEQSCKWFKAAIKNTQETIAFVESIEYSNSDNSDSMNVHEMVTEIERALLLGRRDFEKASWASANTSVSFEEWLLERNLKELVMGG